MTTLSTLSFKRLFHLLKNDLRLQKKPIGIVAAILILFSIMMPIGIYQDFSDYFMMLYLGGFIITSFAFSDLHNYPKAHLFLTLPCSNLERFLNKWILTSIGYALTLLGFYCFLSFLSSIANLFIHQQTIRIIDLSQPDLWIGIYKYIILQSVVFLGAITFKRYVLIKTALTIGLLFLAFSIFLLAINAIMLFPYYNQIELLLNTTHTLAHFIFWFLLAPFCLIITYFRLTEYELN